MEVIDRSWRVLASQRTTAVLALLFSAAAFIAALVPQGSEALVLAKDAGARRLHELAAWGLTDVFVSPFFYAVAALLVGNLVAVAVSNLRSARLGISAEPPKKAPLERQLTAPHPERALERLRETFISRLAQPAGQGVQGARAILVFDSGAGAQLAPLAAHLGLMMLVLGAGLYAASASESSGVPRARLDITDTRTNTTGHFDMVAGEPFQLFQYTARYTLRDYVPSREGLGPAVRIERTQQDQPQPQDFWVYLNAPAGFDQRHRQSEVVFDARWMGLSPLPGQGLADSPLGVLMIVGLALIGIGAMKSTRARGRLWVDVNGDTVRLVGVPAMAGDSDFAASFDRWTLVAQSALEE